MEDWRLVEIFLAIWKKSKEGQPCKVGKEYRIVFECGGLHFLISLQEGRRTLIEQVVVIDPNKEIVVEKLVCSHRDQSSGKLLRLQELRRLKEDWQNFIPACLAELQAAMSLVEEQADEAESPSAFQRRIQAVMTNTQVKSSLCRKFISL